jgi:hypothetical protein
MLFSFSPPQDQRASLRIPPKRRAARVDSDFFAPLWTPTLLPPVWVFSPGRDGTDRVPGFRCGCIVFLPAMSIIRAGAEHRTHKCKFEGAYKRSHGITI